MAEGRRIFGRRRQRPGPKTSDEKKEKKEEQLEENEELKKFAQGVRDHHNLVEGIADDDRLMAAHLLADGWTVAETAVASGLSERTLYRWKNDPDFMDMLDQLTLTTGNATPAGRVRDARMYIRAIEKWKREHDMAPTEKDPLDWQKEIRLDTKDVSVLRDEYVELFANIFARYRSEEPADSRPKENTAESGSNPG